MNTLIAVDVSKDTLQIQTKTKGWAVGNNASGLADLLNQISGVENPFVVFEATGGYERTLLNTMQENSVSMCRINPRRVRAFAQSEGMKAKTDPIDAKMILNFVIEKNLRPMVPMEKEFRQLQALLDRRGHLTEMLAREKTRLKNSDEMIHASIDKVIRLLNEELESIENDIDELIKNHRHLKQRFECLTAIVGVGKVSAWSVLGYLGELAKIGRNQAVALAGIAPFNKDSGKFSGKRRIIGGRAKVRKALYMAAQTASIHNPIIKPYVEHLRAQGKPYKCAMVAAMRKLLIHMRSELIKLDSGLAL
jgi:transposase